MKNIDPLHVVFTVDENYVQHLGVTMLSMLHNKNNGVPFHIVIIGDCLSEESIAVLTQIAESNNASIVFPEIESKYFDTVKLSKKLSYVSKATYGRLAIPEVVDVDKALFLDCDILVRKDISALWNIDISDYYSGAVIDPPINARHGQDDCHRKRLGMPPGAPYYNSGVLLLNLERCRRDDVMGKAFKFMVENPDNLYFLDQDGLNVAMQNNWLTLHPRWNVQSFMFRIFYSDRLRKKFSPEIIDAVKDPAIVHYTGEVKPWHYGCEIPYVEEYYKYLSMTPWKDYRPTDWTFRGMLRKNRRLFKRRFKSAILGYRV